MAYAARKAYVEQPQERSTVQKFRVLEGTGQRAQAQPKTSPELVSVLKIAAVVFAIIFTIGAIRIGFSAHTVGVMMDNNKLKNEIAQVQSVGDDLQVQQSIFGNPTRIERIAEDTLQMVPATSVAELDISSGAVALSAPADTNLTVAENDSTPAGEIAQPLTR